MRSIGEQRHAISADDDGLKSLQKKMTKNERFDSDQILHINIFQFNIGHLRCVCLLHANQTLIILGIRSVKLKHAQR